MRRVGFLVPACVLLALIVPMSGCRKSEQPAAPAAKPSETGAEPAAPTPSAAPAATPDKTTAQLPVVPLGLPPVPIPADNPMTPAKVELGKLLYFDTRLSGDNKISCATCHDPKMAWAEHTPTSEGIHGQRGDRNAPTVINTAYLRLLFWDGRAKSLEEQATGPIENPIEMGMKMPMVIEELEKIPDYQARFKTVFGTGVNKENIAKAIAAFERTVLSGDSPYDRYQNGDKNALSEAQKRGMSVYMDKGFCSTCHTPPIFSNGNFYNAGVGMDKPNPDPGRKKVTGQDRDFGAFRVPTHREVANTYPYFHDGSAKTLEDAVALMAGGGKDNPHLSPILKSIRDAGLTEQDRKDLVEFLKALSGKFPVTEPPKLPS
jgi:cytochrome c peroxidase